ncbi:hypothetical protein HDV05_007939 [Chytridiales sp. JEL 0842]|nr:hypothetical protein HDV05_007939 [Chytridiales sp. JEL 0842]
MAPIAASARQSMYQPEPEPAPLERKQSSIVVDPADELMESLEGETFLQHPAVDESAINQLRAVFIYDFSATEEKFSRLADLALSKQFKSINFDYGKILPSSMVETLDMCWNFFRYWRKLPKPVVPIEVVKKLVEIAEDEPEEEHRMYEMKRLVGRMQKEEFLMLKSVVGHLSRLACAMLNTHEPLFQQIANLMSPVLFRMRCRKKLALHAPITKYVSNVSFADDGTVRPKTPKIPVMLRDSTASKSSQGSQRAQSSESRDSKGSMNVSEGTSNLIQSKTLGLSMGNMHIEAPPPSRKGYDADELQNLWENLSEISDVKGYRPSQVQQERLSIPAVGSVSIPAASPFARSGFLEGSDDAQSVTSGGRSSGKGSNRNLLAEEEAAELEDWMKELMDDPALAAVMPWLRATPETTAVPGRLDPPNRLSVIQDGRESVASKQTGLNSNFSLRPSVSAQASAFYNDDEEEKLSEVSDKTQNGFGPKEGASSVGQQQQQAPEQQVPDVNAALQKVLETEPISMLIPSPRASTGQVEGLEVDIYDDDLTIPSTIEFGESDPEGFGWNLITRKGFAAALFKEQVCLTPSASALEMLMRHYDVVFAWNTFYPH